MLVADNGHEQILGEKHKANDQDSVSQWLLELSGLQNKWIRKNAKGETRSFSFRDIAHLSVVSESDIIRSDSPLFSGQYTKRTEEKSVYKCLLSGVDDSSIVAHSDKKQSKQRVEAKEEILEKLIARADRRIEETELPADLTSLTNHLREIENSIDQETAILQTSKESAASLQETRRSSWIGLKRAESRVDVLSELQSRFSLLHEQYNTDISRLGAIAEASQRLGEMALDYCPVCGASSECQDISHQEYQIDPLRAAESCNSEIARIQDLIADLGVTRADMDREAEALEDEKRKVYDAFKEASSELEENLNPGLREAIRQISLWQDHREKTREAIGLLEQRSEFEELLVQVKAESTAELGKLTFSVLDPSYTEEFAKRVEERLAAWKLPGLDRVTFDEKAWDVLISGRSRSSHGKGVRAVTHAAFTLSLLRYCLDNKLPHSGVVIIDSPLVVYKQPDVGEESFSEDLKAAFFRDLAHSYEDAQIIVIENEVPPADVVSSSEANVVLFTGTSEGRSGFIPKPNHSGMGASE